MGEDGTERRRDGGRRGRRQRIREAAALSFLFLVAEGLPAARLPLLSLLPARHHVCSLVLLHGPRPLALVGHRWCNAGKDYMASASVRGSEGFFWSIHSALRSTAPSSGWSASSSFSSALVAQRMSE